MSVSTSARRLIDYLYRRNRALGQGLDPNLSTSELLAFVASKIAWRVRGLIRGRPLVYMGPAVIIRSRRRLILGRNCSLGSGVRLDAVGGDISLGEHVTVDSNASLKVSGVYRNLGTGIAVGARTSIGMSNVLQGQGGIRIGSDVLLGPNVVIMSENHKFERRDLPIREQGETRQCVDIGDDVWVGSNVTILAGVKVGNGAIVAAGAVVNKDVAPFTIVGGVPAKQIGIRPESRNG